MSFSFEAKQLIEKADNIMSAGPEIGSRRVAEMRKEKHLAIIEVAGRDSAAAAILAAQSGDFDAFMPTAVFTGTEYGNWNQVIRCAEVIADASGNMRCYDLIFLGSPGLWSALNGRLMRELIGRFGSHSPCLGCHLYMHLVRVPLAWHIGAKTIISGERVSHDGKIKINQTKQALDLYQQIMSFAGIDLIMPVREISDGKDIKKIILEEWDQGAKQLQCVFSGNYYGVRNEAILTDGDISYLEQFALPFAKKIIEMWGQGVEPDYLRLALEF